MSQKKLDQIADKVLTHDPNKKGKEVLKVIAGAPDKPLVIDDIEIPCYVLEDETRVFSQRGVFIGLGASRGGGGRRGNAGAQLPRIMASKTIYPFISKELMLALNSPILFQNPLGGGTAHGYPATILVDICEAMLAAQDAGALLPSQKHIAGRCDILVRGLATVGVIGLVDEATGYQQIREERALAKILEKFIAKELQEWTRTFPFEFYEQICRLKKWPDIYSVKRPGVIGRYTNEFVYDRLAPGVLEELKQKNPVLPQGYRRYRHHQWLSPVVGHPKLRDHLAGVIALMRISPSWDVFKRHIKRAYPKPGEQTLMNIEKPDEK